MHTPPFSFRHLIKLAPLYGELIKQGCDEGIFHTQTPLESAEFILSGAQFLTDLEEFTHGHDKI